MIIFGNRLRGLYDRFNFLDTIFRRRRNLPDYHVIVPHDVQLPYPAVNKEEIRVPASINGLDMSTGRL